MKAGMGLALKLAATGWLMVGGSVAVGCAMGVGAILYEAPGLSKLFAIPVLGVGFCFAGMWFLLLEMLVDA